MALLYDFSLRARKHTADYAYPEFHFLAHMKMRGRRRDGSEFPIEIGLGFIEIGSQTLVSSSIQDITERNRTEELAAHLANMVDSSSDAIIGKTLDGTIVSWNKAAEKIYGYKAEEMLGHNVTALIPHSTQTSSRRS
jgi:PAS domain-containing protein